MNDSSGHDAQRLTDNGPVESDDSGDDFPTMCQKLTERERQRNLLDKSHDYMRNADLLPPCDEFADVDCYVAVLRLFARAPTSLQIYRFLPTLAQRRLNAETLMRWQASKPRGRPSDSDYRKRALGLLRWRCFDADSIRKRDGHCVPALAKLAPNTVRDVETRDAMRFLAPLVNDGHLTRGELCDAIIEASLINGHIPDNKSQRFVARQIDDAIAKFSEPFDWSRLDDGC